MNNELRILEILDDCIYKRIDSASAIKTLVDLQVSNPIEEINLHKAAVIALQRNDVLNKVGKAHEDFLRKYQKPQVTVTKPKTKVVSISKWMMRAAAVFIIVVGGWFAYQYNNTNSQQLYAEIYQSYDVNTDRAVVSTIIPHKMVEQYKQKDYASVINTFNTLSTTNNREKFLTAISYHEIGKYNEAITLYSKIIAENKLTGSRLYNDDAAFFMTLSYLKLGDNKNALLWMKKIAEDKSHTYNEKVSKWLITRLKWIQ